MCGGVIVTALTVLRASARTDDYLIDVWSSEAGLRSSSVTAITQTPTALSRVNLTPLSSWP